MSIPRMSGLAVSVAVCALLALLAGATLAAGASCPVVSVQVSNGTGPPGESVVPVVAQVLTERMGQQAAPQAHPACQAAEHAGFVGGSRAVGADIEGRYQD